MKLLLKIGSQNCMLPSVKLKAMLTWSKPCVLLGTGVNVRQIWKHPAFRILSEMLVTVQKKKIICFNSFITCCVLLQIHEVPSNWLWIQFINWIQVAFQWHLEYTSDSWTCFSFLYNSSLTPIIAKYFALNNSAKQL